MNFSQKLGICILIVITAIYIYFSFFGNNSWSEFKKNILENETTKNEYSPIENTNNENENLNSNKGIKKVKIYILDKSGKLRSVYRTCDTEIEKSCFEYSIKELLNAPSKWEKNKGFMSEIPTGTKLLSIRESSKSILIDLSSEFETGGGAESTYTRVKQVIKTANANTSIPTFLYINGHQANVIGGEGIMVKQPLNERSLDE